MPWIERAAGDITITTSMAKAKHLASIISDTVPMTPKALQVFVAYTAGYIIKKEAIDSSRIRHSPRWPILKHIPIVSQTARWGEIADGISNIAFTAALEVDLDSADSFTHGRLQNLANLLSTIYLASKKNSKTLDSQVQTGAENWLNQENH